MTHFKSFQSIDMDIEPATKKWEFKNYEFIVATMVRVAWVAPSDKSNMRESAHKWSCGPPAYSIIR